MFYNCSNMLGSLRNATFPYFLVPTGFPDDRAATRGGIVRAEPLGRFRRRVGLRTSATRRCTFAHVAPAAPTATNVATQWCGCAQKPNRQQPSPFAQITTDAPGGGAG